MRTRVFSNAMGQLSRNATRYALEQMRGKTPEQLAVIAGKEKIENERFQRGMEICLECGGEKNIENVICELCGKDTLPF